MKKTKLSNNQQGFVSIIVTMILMIVLTLIVLGFAQLARREQRAALDRQLSTQAFYAAESGINDLAASFKDPANAAYYSANPFNRNCSNTGSIPGLNPSINPTYNVSYSCVMYDSGPPTIQKDGVSAGQATVIPITNNNLASLKISWQHDSTDGTWQGTSPATLPNYGGWAADPGLLRVMLIPRSSIKRFDYLNRTFTGFFYPRASGATTGNVDYGPATGINSSGVLDEGACNPGNTPYKCNMLIKNINTAYSGRGWYIVLLSMYRSSNVLITCNNSAGGAAANDVPCTGAQLQIDVTGKANDVVRRIQVRKPLLQGAGDFLPIGFESANSICKKIQVAPPNVNDVGNGLGCSAF